MAIFIQTFHPNMDGEITLRFFLQFRLTGYVLFIIGIIVSGIVNKILVDARDSEEYRKRVQYLYDFLNKNGLKVDINNRNPSRLSRMPGVTRNGVLQTLVDTNIGRRYWNEYKQTNGIQWFLCKMANIL